ncbi:MAG: hypothetical protein A2831_01770 [Candidatus Yanofskybacteria bacterium RIFCSPHIGHO2_01_FULL_44_17]|uniref:Endolytic murein transglycosylase n=1 Tax=Candidatus Yanofskybacteria bacterium RIFCSPHIGHO2_01_FULL_44_17 TaxID=1802668 RepID=A0A1F8ESH2_9BACT|nr:MAG: hypothetical protein A2831_01770 [Candidatus Yanofskybacteria bacterium RIFCSPHIGHO2_01_FULL_44_17]
MWNKSETEKISKLAVVIILAVLVLGAALVSAPGKYGTNQEGLEFEVKNGQTLSEVGELLKGRDVINSKLLFVGYAIFTGHEKDFKVGRYLISSGMSISKLVSIFSSGSSESDDIEVTIPEGTNIADIDKIFVKSGLTKEGDILSYDLRYGSALVQEGFLFPDTYRFKRSELGQPVAAEDIVKKMRDNFELKTRDTFSGHFTGEGGADRGYGVVIIASILEKEVRTEGDMRLVAGIIEKRLELGIPLELDATVAYGVCYKQFLVGKYCDVSLANIVDNIRIDSEYNTYRRKGLPIGPISNPGLIAMSAAMNPLASDYLFYLSARDGTTIFSKNASEHERARQKYLK